VRPIEHTIEIRADRSAVFALTQDYDRRLSWDPFLTEARLLGGATRAGIGVRAWCVARHGLGMETEYITFDPPQLAAVKMTRGPAFLASFAGSWVLRDLPGGATQVAFRYHFTPRPRWLAFLVGPVFRLVFARETRRRLTALKAALETEHPPVPSA
jgi:ribosome-associated toxin RatA of RatAB toxin-antitoxin module